MLVLQIAFLTYVGGLLLLQHELQQNMQLIDLPDRHDSMDSLSSAISLQLFDLTTKIRALFCYVLVLTSDQIPEDGQCFSPHLTRSKQ